MPDYENQKKLNGEKTMSIVKLFTATFLSVIFVPAAWADAFPRSGTGKADNKLHYVCRDGSGSVPSELNDALYALNVQNYVLTGVLLYGYPCVPLVDVFYDDALDGDPGVLGLSYCRVALQGNVCIEGQAWIDKSNIATAASDAGISASDLRKTVWCHETGHTFGLIHDSAGSDCMTSGAIVSSTLKAHHQTHIKNDL